MICSANTIQRRTLRCKFFEITVPRVLTTNASDLLERLSTYLVRADNNPSWSTAETTGRTLCYNGHMWVCRQKNDNKLNLLLCVW